ncbi:hypothetical protein HBH70_079610 [Parastagonospora nodorum]|nr:hypothetical protein HBH70_079610 [Parastagonospora nodorum]
MLLCWIIKLLSISSADKYSKKHLKVCEADALKQVGANVRERGNKNCSSLYYSDSNSDTATRKMRIKAYSLLDSDDYCLDSSLDIDPKDDLEDKKATTVKDLAREQKERLKALLNAKMRDSLSARKNEVVAIDSVNSILCDLSDLLVVRFCIFSDSALENIGILTNEKVIIAEANMPAVHPKATKYCLALSAAQFALVCGFGKVDKHIFRAYNTISVTAQRMIIRKGGSYGRTVFDKFYNCKSEGIIIAKFY